MDISAVNSNFNAVNRAVFSAADNTDDGDTAPVREQRNRTGVSATSVENLLTPTAAIEDLARESGQANQPREKGHSKINVTI